MVDEKYSIAYSEVLERLKHISQEDYEKIPKSKIELYKENANKNYVFNYNPTKTLNEQNVSKIAKGIIAILFRDYWATPEQREKIIKKQNNDRIQIEKEKTKKYNPDVFKANKNKEEAKTYDIDAFNANKNNEESKTKALVNVEKSKWYEKFFAFIKNIFGKKY